MGRGIGRKALVLEYGCFLGVEWVSFALQDSWNLEEGASGEMFSGFSVGGDGSLSGWAIWDWSW